MAEVHAPLPGQSPPTPEDHPIIPSTDAPRAPRALAGEQRVMLHDIDWDGYETLLRLVGDGHVRITYDRGDLEIMSPSHDREHLKRLLGRLVETVTEELDIPCDAAGSTTWRRRARARGLEADECFYLGNLPRVLGKRDINLDTDPPPDLAIEVEITHSSLDKLGIYAGLGIPEVWRFDGQDLTIHQLQPDGPYRIVTRSPSLPMITPEEIVHWVQEGATIGNRSAWGRRLRAWVRAVLMPRRAAGNETQGGG